MTPDLTPAQAARLDEVERVARAMHVAHLEARQVGDPPTPTIGTYRRLAVAAIDVMRGAVDDGAAASLECVRCGHSPEAHDWGSLCHVCYRCPGFVKAAAGAPTTAEGGEQPCDSRGPRIGSEGTPRCRLPIGHDGPHRPAYEDGWGHTMTWTDPR